MTNEDLISATNVAFERYMYLEAAERGWNRTAVRLAKNTVDIYLKKLAQRGLTFDPWDKTANAVP